MLSYTVYAPFMVRCGKVLTKFRDTHNSENTNKKRLLKHVPTLGVKMERLVSVQSTTLAVCVREYYGCQAQPR